MHHSLRRGTWASSRRSRYNSLWVDQSTGSLPTPHLWSTSCLHGRVKWGWRTHYNPLPESLANGISLSSGESIYLEINIPPSPVDEPDQKVLPIGKFSSIIMDSPHKATPPKLEGEISMTMEVGNLLSWSMLDGLYGHHVTSSWWIPHPRQAPKRRWRWWKHL